MYWFSPFALGAEVRDLLAEAGLQRFPGDQHQLPEGTLLIYSPPHTLLAEGGDAAALLAGFRALQDRGSRCRLIADWRLLGLSPEEIAGWLNDLYPCPPVNCPPPSPVEPLQALVVRGVLESVPELLDSYLDLELQAELAQTSPDSTYGQRVLTHQDANQLLDAWRRQQLEHAEWTRELAALREREATLEEDLMQREAALSAAGADKRVISEYLHPVQEELDKYYFAHKQLEEQCKELSSLIMGKDSQLAEYQEQILALEEELRQRGAAVTSAQAECQAVNEHLHHVQEELEHYFMQSRSQMELINDLERQQQRALKLLAQSSKS